METTSDKVDDVINTNDKMSAMLDKFQLLKEALKDLKALDDPITEDKNLFVNKVEIVIKNLLEIRDNLMSGAQHFLTTRQFDVLTMEEDTLIMDPSIQFFGLDWTLLFSRIQRMKKKILSYIKDLQSKKIDMMTLASILKTISQTSLELHQHCMAVIGDKMADKKNDKKISSQKICVSKEEKVRMLQKNETIPLEKSQCFSEKLRRKSVNFNETLGLSIQHSQRRRPSQVPRNHLSPEPYWDVPWRKLAEGTSKEKKLYK